MSNLYDEVNALFKSLDSLDLPFNRGIVGSTLKKRGVKYESKELSEVVKVVAHDNGLTSTRTSFKEDVLKEIGETIFNECDLREYLVKHGKPNSDAEVKKYSRYVSLAARLLNKYAPKVIEDNAA